MPRALPLFLRGWNALVARVFAAWGRWRLRGGDADTAARFLEAAAARSPGSFGPLLDLTRAHLRRRDLTRARRALARAREASPARFAREASAAMRAEGFDLATLADVPGVGLSGVGRTADSAAAVERPERGTAVLESPSRAPVSVPYGDCKDLDEYTRFRSMPPISPAEVAATDWDSVIDDLLDG
jgi:hypothetical protein